jgi:hypothetical protein
MTKTKLLIEVYEAGLYIYINNNNKKLVIYQCNAWDKISSYFLIKKEYIDINIFFNIIKKLIEN